MYHLSEFLGHFFKFSIASVENNVMSGSIWFFKVLIYSNTIYDVNSLFVIRTSISSWSIQCNSSTCCD